MTAAAEAAWAAAVAKVLKGGDPASLARRTRDGVDLPALSDPLPPAALPLPAPERWRVLQRVDQPAAAEATAAALDEMAGAADGLVIVGADAPTAWGAGLRADADAFGQLLARLDLASTALRFDLGPSAADLVPRLARHIAAQHPATAGLDLDFGFDPLGQLAVTGRALPDWPQEAARLRTSLAADGFSAPLLRADGRVFHAAGASEAQELAGVLAAAVAYLRALEADGASLEEARRRLSFCLAADTDQLLTIAKLRAVRRLWAGIETACGLAPAPIRVHAETAWRNLSAEDVETNILRGASACFAAALGGADGITVLPHSLAAGRPDAFARRLARNTQLVLARESQLWRVSDPVAGAGTFETLTAGLAARAWSLFQAIEDEGGLAASLGTGSFQGRIAAVAEARAQDLAAGREILVGVNAFRPARAGEAPASAPPPAPSTPPALLRPHRLASAFEPNGDGAP